MVAEPWSAGELDLPAGVLVTPAIYLVHHDPARYADRYAFRPERWLGVKPQTYDWIPFGGGLRRCLGRALRSLRCGRS